MTIWQATILGILQGLTEFLPISSSGHLIIGETLLRLPDTHKLLIFDVTLHLGTLISVFIMFWKDIYKLILAFFSIISNLFKRNKTKNKDLEESKRFIFLLIVSTLPLFLVLAAKDQIEMLFSSVRFVGFALLITATILFLTDRIVEGKKRITNTSYPNALTIGLFQLFAIIPGVSRSGSTIFGARLCGLDKETSVKFSMIMSIIAILGAMGSSVKDMLGSSGAALITHIPFSAYAIGLIVSAITGVFAIKFMINLLKKNKFAYFGIYCVILGVTTIILSGK